MLYIIQIRTRYIDLNNSYLKKSEATIQYYISPQKSIKNTDMRHIVVAHKIETNYGAQHSRKIARIISVCNECVENLMIEVIMTLRKLLLLFFHVPLVVTSQHEKLGSELCTSNMIALNDCNWCNCNGKSQYTCKARACNEVDMFGHFNDAIREMDVGMEGHGVWRSSNGNCEPGVYYRKLDLLCVCSETARWPNPLCRDTFQILHPVETTKDEEPVHNKTCIPTKLYLFDCNVCACPASGQIDPKLCTKRKCEGETVAPTSTKDMAEEVYATCIPNKTYKLGCRTCTCLQHNRLLCDNCTVQDDHNRLTGHKTACDFKKPGIVFKKACNFCHCDRNGTIYCTAKKCLKTHADISLPKLQYEHVEQVEDEPNCVPNSKYKKDCNTCHCFMLKGVKYFGCTQKTCNLSSDLKEDTTCVAGTTYKVNCLVCHCVQDEGIKREYCTVDDTCTEDKNILPRRLSSMHGYCEPLHVYQQDCNQCKCLADGKTVACTSKICSKRKDKNIDNILTHFRAALGADLEQKAAVATNSLIMEFIPFVQRGSLCPKGQTYEVGCNICYCMKSGNAVCTTKQC